MGRYTQAVCRLCRRESTKLFLKGDRCNMAKCPIETGRGIPGVHAAKRIKLSDYGKQFREKQQLKRMYGLREGQFRVFFSRARSARGNTGEMLLQSLEMRLDNIVFRLGMALSRPAARQMVLHQHIQVNGRKAYTPSMILKAGDSVNVKDSPKSREFAKKALDATESRVPCAWLNTDRKSFSGSVLHVPTREEIAPVVNEQLVVELCSKS